MDRLLGLTTKVGSVAKAPAGPDPALIIQIGSLARAPAGPAGTREPSQGLTIQIVSLTRALAGPAEGYLSKFDRQHRANYTDCSVARAKYPIWIVSPGLTIQFG